MTQHPSSSSPAHRQRRLALLLSLLVLLIVLMASRADFRRPAEGLVAGAVQYLVYGVVGLSPRTLYTWRLALAGFAHSAVARRWQDAVDADTPQHFTKRDTARLDFSADTIRARVFWTHLQRGEQLIWRLRPNKTGSWAYSPT